MGVLKDFHRQKIGDNLIQTCYDYAKTLGYSFIQVKTVRERCYKNTSVSRGYSGSFL